MAKRSLNNDLQILEDQIIETLLAGHHEWRPDLDYPQSHSDMQGAVRALLRMFEIKRRPIAIDLEYHSRAPDLCAEHFRPIWQKEISEGKTSLGFETWVAQEAHHHIKD